MEIFLIIIAIIIVVVVVLLAIDSQNPNKAGRLSFNDAVRLLTEEEKKKRKTTDDELLEWIDNNPDDGSDQWLDKASEKINTHNYIDEDYITSQDLEDIILDLTEYDDFDDRLEIPIRGINHRGLTDTNIGVFKGYIMPDKYNKHDEYAIGIYANDGTHLGFIEKGQRSFYEKIEENQGLIYCDIEIHTFIDNNGDEKFNGTITINKQDLI